MARHAHPRRGTLGAFAALATTIVLPCLAPAPARAAGGGPDLGGYSWADSDELGISADPQPFNQTNLRTTYGFTGDEVVVNIPLPASIFPTGFPYYGSSYTSLWLSSNGWLSFVDPLGNPAPTPANVPTSTRPDAVVAFFWDDWTLEGAAPVAIGGANAAGDGFSLLVRMFTKAGPPLFTQALVTLYVNGSIKVIYGGDNAAMKTARTVIGIENAPGVIGLPYMSGGVPQNGASFRSDYAVAFFPRGNLVCTGATALGCPQAPTPYSNAAGSDLVSSYNCDTAAWHGNEKVFQLVLTRPTDVTLTLINADGRNRALFLMRASCSEFTGCLSGGFPVIQTQFLRPGTYYVVVDGLTAADNGPFTLAVACQDSVRAIPCPASLTGETLSGASVFTGWSCTAPAALAGPERVYSVNAFGPTTLEATLTGASDPSLRVLLTDGNGLNPAMPVCLDAAADTVRRWNVGTGTWYVVVDGELPASYDLSVRCAPRLACPVPPRVLPLTPPAPVAGDTTGKVDTVDTYLCGAAEVTGLTGGEDVWQFTLAAPQSVAFVLDAANPDLRLLVLRECYEGSCVFAGGCAEDLAAGTYRLVVDGVAGAAGPYTITPYVMPAGGWQHWTACPECIRSSPPFCTGRPDDVGKKTWAFDDGNFCGTGCTFSLFAVADCGTEMHFPLYDVETGHMRIRDMLAGRDLDLVATNDIPANPGLDPSCRLTTTGTTVSWEDGGCSAIPCPAGGCGGGDDCRTNKTVMDVSFKGSPVVCGVFRVDFDNWGGNQWLAYANCTQDRTPQYDLYADLCSAVAAYEPLPEGGLETTTLDETQCPALAVSGVLTVDDVGCLPLAGYEVTIEQAPPLPANTQTLRVDLQPGESGAVPWTYNLSAAPATLIFQVDPADRVRECSESTGSTVSCGVTAGLVRRIELPVCGGCNNVAPPGLGNELRAVRAGRDAELSWQRVVASPVSVYRVYKDAAKDVRAAPVEIAEVSDPTVTARETGAVDLAPAMAYYQAVAVSCRGDLEGPY